ncbi:unnamed protein product [Lactuca virosa]|uniref:G-box binding protein multifunctional mosaic region domain-containing protein n=1 Tax=Lactuca virosa TaxID=75947 RepID=A0AAU9M3T3_9ASTR|nr:unnamed protein product [Lactuca virosa]
MEALLSRHAYPVFLGQLDPSHPSRVVSLTLPIRSHPGTAILPHHSLAAISSVPVRLPFSTSHLRLKRRKNRRYYKDIKSRRHQIFWQHFDISSRGFMGAEEQSSPAKHSNPTSTQETTPSPYPDWSQACYSSGFAPPFFASSPAPPYMWGGQHPMMPPYGTAVPYPTMYAPPGIYRHPSMPMTPSQPNPELEVKATNGKDRAPNKKSKGNSGNSNAGGGRAASSSGNDGATQSAESGNDVSSDGTDEDYRQEYSGSKKGSFHQMLADANARNNNSGPTPVPGNPVASMPPTDLNMGIDLWNPSTGTGSMNLQKNHSGVQQTPAPPPMMPDHWVQVYLKPV